jgi:hypothetical protein
MLENRENFFSENGKRIIMGLNIVSICGKVGEKCGIIERERERERERELQLWFSRTED